MAPTKKFRDHTPTVKGALTASDAQGSIFDLSYGSEGKGLLTKHGRSAPPSIPTRKPKLVETTPKEDVLARWGSLSS